MILRAISSLIATRDSLTLTMMLPPQRGDNRHVSAHDKPQVFQMLANLLAAADAADHNLFVEIR